MCMMSRYDDVGPCKTRCVHHISCKFVSYGHADPYSVMHVHMTNAVWYKSWLEKMKATCWDASNMHASGSSKHACMCT